MHMFSNTCLAMLNTFTGILPGWLIQPEVGSSDVYLSRHAAMTEIGLLSALRERKESHRQLNLISMVKQV